MNRALCSTHILCLWPTLDSIFDSTFDSTLDSTWTLVPHCNLETWKWFDLIGYFNGVCNGNAGPSEMLFKQPRAQSCSEHSCYLFAMFDFTKIFNLAKLEHAKLMSLLSKYNSTKMLTLLLLLSHSYSTVCLKSLLLPDLLSTFWMTQVDDC